MKPKVVFRADGGPLIGMGHFIRTLALADMLKTDFYCVFATQVPSQYQVNEIEKVCHSRIDLPADHSHFNVFLQFLQGDEIVVLDNYYFTTDYQRKIKAKGCKLVCIDDIHDKHYVADAVINHAEGIEPHQFSIEPGTKLFLGYKYALLRGEYLKPATSQNQKQYSWVMMMGGSDPKGLTLKILSLINTDEFSLPIAVIVGAGFTDDQQVQAYPNVVLFKGIDASKVLELMHVSKFGILPASTVAIEACAARLPFICGYFVDNQVEVYGGIKTNKLAFCVGDYSTITKEALSNAMSTIENGNLATEIIENQKKRLDKKSNERIFQLFKEL